MNGYEVLLIGGPAGVGKSSVAWEISAQLEARDVAHCMVEGDTLDQVHPAPPGDPHRTHITERNLAAIWANYAALGQRRLVYCNTVSILEAPMIIRAMGDPATRATCVLLTASHDVVRARLAQREIGTKLDDHVERSAHLAKRLDAEAPEGTIRIATDDRSVTDIAIELCGRWLYP